jgi:cytochrome c peroxidase
MNTKKQTHSYRTSAVIGLAVVAFFAYATLNDTATAGTPQGTPYVLDPPLALMGPDRYIPEDNPLTKEKVELGTLLFFDKRLSVNNTVSCATCHMAELAYTDGQPVSTGVFRRQGGRSAPTAINRLYSTAQFWDGRKESLEAQSVMPIIDHVEMGMPSHDAVVKKVNGIDGYRTWFKNVFGTDVTIDGVGKALASFQRTLLSGNSPVDQFDRGVSDDALSLSGQRGMEIFRNKGRCTSCHSGFNFTDERFHNLGIGWDTGTVDLGRYRVTKDKKDIAAFKTPTLREVANTAPYMHDGRFGTLREVVNFYSDGGIKNPFQDSDILVLNLSDQEKKDLVAFLRGLSGEGWQHVTPPTEFPQ